MERQVSKYNLGDLDGLIKEFLGALTEYSFKSAIETVVAGNKLF